MFNCSNIRSKLWRRESEQQQAGWEIDSKMQLQMAKDIFKNVLLHFLTGQYPKLVLKVWPVIVSSKPSIPDQRQAGQSHRPTRQVEVSLSLSSRPTPTGGGRQPRRSYYFLTYLAAASRCRGSWRWACCTQCRSDYSCTWHWISSRCGLGNKDMDGV